MQAIVSTSGHDAGVGIGGKQLVVSSEQFVLSSHPLHLPTPCSLLHTSYIWCMIDAFTAYYLLLATCYLIPISLIYFLLLASC